MEVFDIFLSHNSADKPAVEVIAHKLKDAGLEPRLELGLRLSRDSSGRTIWIADAHRAATESVSLFVRMKS